MSTENVSSNTSLKPDRLRSAREKLGLTQHQLARICGFGVNQVSRYELGLSDPSGMAFRKMADALEVSVDYLMGLSDEPHGQVTVSDIGYQEREIIETFRREGWRGVGHLSLERLGK